MSSTGLKYVYLFFNYRTRESRPAAFHFISCETAFFLPARISAILGEASTLLQLALAWLPGYTISRFQYDNLDHITYKYQVKTRYRIQTSRQTANYNNIITVWYTNLFKFKFMNIFLHFIESKEIKYFLLFLTIFIYLYILTASSYFSLHESELCIRCEKIK